MKIMRRRRPSMKTALGITKAKRSFARATGIPTTKQGRKRKPMNALTGGAYGKYERTRAAVNRPFKTLKHPPAPMGCLIYVISLAVFLALLILVAL